MNLRSSSVGNAGVPSALRNNSTLIAKVLVLVGTIGIIYGTDLSVVFGKALVFSAGNITNYVLVIPMLILFVLHRKRKILLTTASYQDRRGHALRLDDVIGAALAAIAVIVYVIGSTTLYSLEYHLLSLPVFVAGGTLLLFNMATLRHSFIALILLAYLQPPPAELLGELAADMSWSSALLVEFGLSAIGLPISLDASFGAPALVVEDADGSKIPFYVGEPSSGTYSIVGLSVFSIFVSYILRGKLWKRALILLVGFPVFYLLNATRIALIISIWYTSGEVAAESFHVVSGTVMSAVGTLILLFFADLVLHLRVRGPPKREGKCPSCEKSLAAGESLCLLCGRLLRPLTSRINGVVVSRMVLLGLISTLVIAAQIAAMQSASAKAASNLTLYNLNIDTIEGPETTSYFFPTIEGWDLKYGFRDTRVEKILNQDASLAYRYTSNATAGSGPLVGKPTILAGLQISRSLHTWEGSLLVYPSQFGRPTATTHALEWVDITDDKKGRFFAYQKPGQPTTEAVLYWTDRRELRFSSGLESRNVQVILWANMDNLARVGAIDSNRDVENTKELLLSLARPITAFWEEISISSISARTVDAVLTRRPYIPLGITVIVAAIFAMAVVSKNSSLYRSNRKLYDQIKVGEEKLILDAIVDNRRGTGKMMTGEAIVESHPDLSSNTNTASKLISMLTQIRNIGLIKDKIQNNFDEPLLVWKPNFLVDDKSTRRRSLTR
ncbi:MAG: exosortase/archaeosortase family protein [Nitrososphaera sp.]|nr:exosortase/archaeosortase family protein [Nitrososphaera sp.]